MTRGKCGVPASLQDIPCGEQIWAEAGLHIRPFRQTMLLFSQRVRGKKYQPAIARPVPLAGGEKQMRGNHRQAAQTDVHPLWAVHVAERQDVSLLPLRSLLCQDMLSHFLSTGQRTSCSPGHDLATRRGVISRSPEPPRKMRVVPRHAHTQTHKRAEMCGRLPALCQSDNCSDLQCYRAL